MRVYSVVLNNNGRQVVDLSKYSELLLRGVLSLSEEEVDGMSYRDQCGVRVLEYGDDILEVGLIEGLSSWELFCREVFRGVYEAFDIDWSKKRRAVMCFHGVLLEYIMGEMQLGYRLQVELLLENNDLFAKYGNEWVIL